MLDRYVLDPYLLIGLVDDSQPQAAFMAGAVFQSIRLNDYQAVMPVSGLRVISRSLCSGHIGRPKWQLCLQAIKSCGLDLLRVMLLPDVWDTQFFPDLQSSSRLALMRQWERCCLATREMLFVASHLELPVITARPSDLPDLGTIPYVRPNISGSLEEV